MDKVFNAGDYILIEDLPKPALVEEGVKINDEYLLITFPHLEKIDPTYLGAILNPCDFENICKISKEFAELLQRFSDEELLKFHQNFLIRPKKEVTWEEFVKNKYWRKYGKDPYAQ